MCGAETWVSPDSFHMVYIFTNFIVPKVNFTLEQGCEVPEWEQRYSSIISLTLPLDGSG